MKISKDKVVSVNYHLAASKDGGAEELVEQTNEQHPFVFLVGSDSVLPLFEENLANKEKGNTFDFTIKPEDGYGIFEQEYVIPVPRHVFEVDGVFDTDRIKVGADVPMNDQDGNQLMGRVVEINDTGVIMDFNHPLASHTLHFVGSVLDVREATEEELDHGHVHGPGGHHH
jgi:FKBP-type peptidyl-prolyl cis-trans isomerase SlyD